MKIFTRSKIIGCIVICSLLGSPVWARDRAVNPPHQLSLQLRWFHQFQFAGYYAAREKGYYQQAGLDVKIEEGGFAVNTIDEVVKGRAHFGVTNSEVLISRLKERKKVSVVACIFQHSPLVFITRQETGITHPQDFIDRRVKMTMSARDLELHAMLLAEGVMFDRFQLIDGPSNKDQLFDPGIDVAAVYVTNEPYYLMEKNIRFNIIRPSAYGVDFYGDLIFTREQWAKEHPNIVSAFKTASIRGWKYAMSNKEEVIDLIHRQYSAKKSKSHLAYEAKAMEKLILPDLIDIGHVNPGRWYSIAKVFVDQEIIDKVSSLDGFIFSEKPLNEGGFQRSHAVMLGIIILISLISMFLYKFNSRLNREIKEKEATQKELAQSESRLKAMFENIHSGVAVFSAVEDGTDFIIKNLNKAAQRIEDVSLDNVAGESVARVFPGIAEFGLLDVFRRVYRTGNPEHMPASLYKDHRIVGWRENYVYRLPSGEIAAVYNDETVRKKAEIYRKHLETVNHIIINTRHSQKMLQQLLDAMLEIFDSDRVWLLYPCDPKAEFYTLNVERHRPRWPGTDASDKQIPMDENMALSMRTLLDTNKPVEYGHKELSAPLGDTGWFSNIKSELRVAIYPEINSAWVLGMHRCESDHAWTSDEKILFHTIGRRISDGLNAMLLIRELKKTNQGLKESEDRFAKIFHASPVGIMIATQPELRILNANESLCRITGYSKKTLVGTSLLDTDHFVIPDSLKIFKILRETGSVNNLSMDFAMPQNRCRSGRVSSQAVTIGSNKCLIITLEDITEYKRAENEKLMAHRHAAEQEKYALIGQVAGKIAHDFNNILGAVMGNAELSLLDCGDPQIKKTLELILEQTKRGRNLTRNLVVFAKDQEPRQDFFSINEKVTLVLNLLKKDLEGIGIITSLSDPLPQLLADPGMIENALVNMIHNAIHAMSKTALPRLELSTYTGKDHIVIEIGDNGCGIPKEHEKSVYTPGFTLKNSRDIMETYDKTIKGTGYGLFNVKKIVEKHRGQIWFETRENEGTRFYISLPVIKKALTRQEKEEIGQSILYTGKKILIVEDEQSISGVQSSILVREPFLHQVDIAHNGHMALELLEQNNYDLISLDYRLPGGLSGMDLYRHIRQQNRMVPVLFISGNVEFLESVDDLMKKDRYLACLSKPCQNREYVNGINRLLGSV